MNPPRSLAERLAAVVPALAADHPPDRILDDLLDGPALKEDDQAAFYALALEASCAHPDAVGFLADAFVELADHLVVSLAPDRPARVECALAWYLAAGELYQGELADMARLRTRVALALPHRLVGDWAENIADAVATARTAVEAARDLDGHTILAEALAALGSVLLERDSPPPEAAQAYEESAEHFLLAGDRPGWAEATLDAAVALTECDLPVEADARAEVLSHAADLCASVAAELATLPPRLAALAALSSSKVAIARGGPAPLDLAIEILEGALKGPAESLHLADEAKLHVNLGVAYGARLLGDPEENLERAVQAFETARDLFYPHLPVDAALTDLNLAASYGERLRGYPESNLGLALSSGRRALDAFHSLGHLDLARTASLTLGCLLVRYHSSSAMFGEGVERLATLAADESTPSYDRALAQAALAPAQATVGIDPVASLRAAAATFEALGARERWGQTLCDLAACLPPVEAIPLYRRLLDRLALEVHPSLRLRAAESLTFLQPHSEALAASRDAVQAALHLASLAPDDPYRAHVLSEAARPILARHIRLSTQARQIDDAHQTALHALGLSLLSGLGPRTPGASASGGLRHEAFRRAIVEDLRLSDDLRPTLGRLAPRVPSRTSNLAAAWRDHRAPMSRVSLSVLEPRLNEAILTTFVGPDGLWTGWQSHGVPLKAQWHSTEVVEALDQLTAAIYSPMASYSWTRSGWGPKVEASLAQFADALGLARLVGDLPSTCSSLTIRPHGSLHVIPFAALPLGGGLLGARFPKGITLLPLPIAHVGHDPNPLSDLVSVTPPPTAPRFAGLELALANVHARPSSPAALHDVAVRMSALHVASHATLHHTDPLAASLDVGGGAGITPYDLPLSDCSLVTLAACGTAQVDLDVAGVDVIGLQSAFLLAGARSVVASLWPVGDAASAVLLGRFYSELYQGLGPRQALARAQSWTRRVTVPVLRSWASRCSDPRVDELLDDVDAYALRSPFASPTEWAAFTLYESRRIAPMSKPTAP